jgi:Ca2+/Na+ antiporter
MPALAVIDSILAGQNTPYIISIAVIFFVLFLLYVWVSYETGYTIDDSGTTVNVYIIEPNNGDLGKIAIEKHKMSVPQEGASDDMTKKKMQKIINQS